MAVQAVQPTSMSTFKLVSAACLFGVCIKTFVESYPTGVLRSSVTSIPEEYLQPKLSAYEENNNDMSKVSTRSPVSLISRGGLLSSLSHALDPVSPVELEHRVTRDSTHVAFSTDETKDQQHSTLDTNPTTSWSWSNYTFPAHDIWPQCSSTPNCLKFSFDKQGCEKWKQVASYPILVGDMDGSGSRGITWLLRAGGVWMRTTNEWLDWAKDEHPLSNAIMQSTHTLDYQVTRFALNIIIK